MTHSSCTSFKRRHQWEGQLPPPGGVWVTSHMRTHHVMAGSFPHYKPSKEREKERDRERERERKW